MKSVIKQLSAGLLTLFSASLLHGAAFSPPCENRQNDNLTLLSQAVMIRQEDEVRSLLASGIKPTNDRDILGSTPLCEAAFEGNIVIIDLLLTEGADPNFASDTDRTPLHCASMAGHEDAVARLLTAGAQPNHKDRDGTQPLHDAAFEGHKGVVELLLAEGADPYAVTKFGRTPLHLAAKGKHVDEVTRAGHIKSGHLDIIQSLLAKDANPNAVDNNGRTPLHEASQRGYADAVALLLDAEARPDVPDNNGKTPLQLAFENAVYLVDLGYRRVIELLAAPLIEPEPRTKRQRS